MPAMKRVIPGAGSYGRSMKNCSVLAEPALDRRAQRAPARHVEVAGRARAGVEVLVGAADGVADAALVQLDRDRARRMAEVPDHRARVSIASMSASSPRAVVDVREHDQAVGIVGGGSPSKMFSFRPRARAMPSST